MPPRDYLKHILDEADYLIEHSQGLDRDKFLRDETLRRAFVRSLEIIGEAAKGIPSDITRRSIRKSSGEVWPECVTG